MYTEKCAGCLCLCWVKTNVCFVSVSRATRIQATRLPSGPVGKTEQFIILLILGLAEFYDIMTLID